MKINPKESLTVTFSIDPSAMSSLPRIVFCFVLFFFLKSFFSLFGPPPFFLFLLFSRLLVQWTQWRDLKITKRPVKRSSWWENKKKTKKNQTKKSPFRNFPRRFAAVVLFFTEFCRVLPSFCECQVQLQKNKLRPLTHLFLFACTFIERFWMIWNRFFPSFYSNVLCSPTWFRANDHFDAAE